MKITNHKFLIAILTAFLISGVWNTISAEKKGHPSINFTELSYNFGTIKENGGKVSHDFIFTNEGEGNLVIHSATPQCGCTVPEFPQEPIGPGKTGILKVVFNPGGQRGTFTKTVTVRCNGHPGKVVIKLQGTVIPSK